jgi:peptidoglycan/xylan/chitin deacetylase (PgdA/CDA1 family)
MRSIRPRMAVVVTAAMVLLMSWPASPAAGVTPVAPAQLDIPVLMYHDFTAAAKGSQFATSVSLFTQQMQYLVDHGYTSVLPADLAAAARGDKALPAKPVMITFDDWYPSQDTMAVPVLDKLGLKGVFFVISGKVSSPAEQKKLRELAAHGHVIGSHTVHHYYLTKTTCSRTASGCCAVGRPCTDAEITAELTDSKKALEAILGAPVTALAWPGNYYDDRTIKLAEAAGYQTIFAVEKQVTENGVLVNTVGTTMSLATIHRIEIGGQCAMDYFPRSLQDHRCCLTSDREFHKHCRPRENALLPGKE